MNSVKAIVAFIGFSLLLIWNPIPTALFGSAAFWTLIASGLIALNFGDIFILKAFSTLGPARTLFVFSFEPFVLAVSSHFIFGQELGLKHILGIVILMSCILSLSYEGFKKHGHWEWRGILFALLAMTLDCVGIVLSRHALDHEPSLSVLQGNWIRALGAIVGIGILSIFIKIRWKENWQRLTGRQQAGALAVSFTGTFLSLSFWLHAISRGHVGSVAAVGNSSPLFATALELILSREKPSIYFLVALCFFLMGLGIFIFL